MALRPAKSLDPPAWRRWNAGPSSAVIWWALGRRAGYCRKCPLLAWSSPPLHHWTRKQQAGGFVGGSLITQRRPTTTATGYKQNTRPYPRQQLISYVVDDRRLVLLAYRCHLIRYPHWNLKEQMPWWDTCGDLSGEHVLEEDVLCNWMISSRLVNMFLMSARGSMFSRVSFW